MSKRKQLDRILFYRVRGESFGCFSNFSPHKITIDDVLYLTSEHYYQSKKFEGTKYEAITRKCSNKPGEVAMFARQKDLPLRKDWEEVKDGVMEKALRAKFTQNDKIREILLSTKDRELVEDSPSDFYWGCGRNGTGRNMLGKLLMKIRDEFALSDAKKSKKNE